MSSDIEKLLVVPTDDSVASRNALDYIGHFFGASPKVAVILLYILPALPPILVEESRRNRQTAALLDKMDKKNRELADIALAYGRQRLQERGFDEKQIQTTLQVQTTTIANEICKFAEDRTADAIVLGSRGRSRLEAFFMGATAVKVIDAGKLCPTWVVLGKAKQRGVLIAVDRSPEALRAVDHAGFILAGVPHPVTLFYSLRSLTAFVPHQVADAAPDLEQIWQDRIGKAIAPVMTQARDQLVHAGVAASRITVQVAQGTRSAAADIIKTARELNCGTIIMGRRGTGSQGNIFLGSVSRKVVEGVEDTAVWIVP